MAASDRPQIGGAPRGSARSLRLRAAAVNRLEIPLGSMTGPDRAIPRSSGALPGASWGGTLPLAAGRCLPGEDSTQRRPRLRHSELWARSFLDLGALPGRAACEISGRPRDPAGFRRERGARRRTRARKGGSAFGPQDAGLLVPRGARGRRRICMRLSGQSLVRMKDLPIVRRTASARRRPAARPRSLDGGGRRGSATLSPARRIRLVA